MPAELSDAEVFGTGTELSDEQVFGKAPSKELSDEEVFGSPSPTPETDSVLSKLNRWAKTPSPQWIQPIEKAITSPLPGAKEVIHAGYEYSPFGLIEDIAPNSAAGKWAHDIRTHLEQVGTGFASPANLALAATGTSVGKAIQGLIGMGFTAQQAKATLDTYRQWQQTTDPEQKHQLSIKLGVDAGLTALLGGGTAAGAIAPERAVARPEGAPATLTPPEAQTRPVQPIQAQERPSGESPEAGKARFFAAGERLKAVGGNPIAVAEELANSMKTNPTWSQMADAVEAKIAGGETTDAQQISQTSAANGRLRPRSELPVVSPEEGSPGVQPSGQGEGVAIPSPQEDVTVTQPEGGGSPATAAVSGAETPPAAEPPSVTSIKNATVDAERASRGLPPAMSAIERDFPEVRDQLLKKLDQDPVYQDNLIEELKAKPRALTDLEDAALLHRQVDLQNQFEKTANNLIIANESGDLGAVDELNIRAANLSDKLLELYDVGKASGTETGRGLNARKMLANEDFSLASMITQKRAVVKGRQLTPEQVAEVGRAHKDITAKQIAYDAYETSPRAEAYRKRLRNLAAEYRERTAKGDFATRPRKQIPLDPEAMKLKADVERARIDFKRGLAKDRLQNRTWWEKALDGIAKWRRTFILSWPTVLGKLTTASGELIGITPAEEFIRKGVTKVLPEKVTSKSLRYGEGSSLKTEVGAVVHTWKELFKAVPQRFKTGNADIDLLYGRPDIVPSELKDYVSNLHSALKEPARQNEFFRAQQQILQRYAERGVDISDPIIQTKAGFEAYRHANSQIFVEDNRLANAINAFIGRLGDINKLTRKPSGIGKVAQTAARYEFPIVRIPLNIIKRTFEYSAGVPLGTARLVRGMIEGLDGMAAPEADAIIRNLSRGALGATAIAYGYFHPEQFGGYYQRGEKRAPDDLKPGHARVLGRDLPPWAVHNPLLAQFQIGSSIRRIVDSKLRKRDVSGPSYRQAIVATYGGVIEDAPLVRQTEDSLKALDIRQQNQFLGEHLKSGIPGAVEWAAQQLDKDANGNPVVRKPEDILDYVKMGIPGLRQQVPEKEGRTRVDPFR